MEDSARQDLVAQVLEAVGLDVAATDVVSIHLGVRSIGIRRKVRGRGGKVVYGHTLTTSHPILPEPLED